MSDEAVHGRSLHRRVEELEHYVSQLLDIQDDRSGLRAEIEHLQQELAGYQVDGGYQKGYEHGMAAAEQFKAEADRLRAAIEAHRDANGSYQTCRVPRCEAGCANDRRLYAALGEPE